MQKRTAIITGALGVSTITTALLVMLIPDEEMTALDGLHFSAPSIDALAMVEDDILGAKQVRYTSDTFSYQIVYPSTWNLDDRKSISPTDVLYGPQKEVIVRINTSALGTVTNQEELERRADEIEDALRNDESFELHTTKRVSWKNYPTVRTEGVRTTANNTWKIISIAVFRIDQGDMFTIVFTLPEEKFVQYNDSIETILDSLQV